MTPPFDLGKILQNPDVKHFVQVATDPGNLKQARDIAKGVLESNHLDQASKYLPNDSQLESLSKMANAFLNAPNRKGAESSAERHVPEHYIPVHVSTPEHSEQGAATQQAQASNLKWLPLPSDAEARQVMNTLAHDASPCSTLHQDSLNIFLNHSETTKMFQGNQLSSSAATLLPKGALHQILSTLSLKMPTPEMAKALSLLQTLLPNLVGHEGSGQVAELVHQWVSSQGANVDLPKVFESLVDLLQQSGLGATEQGQDLVKALFQESGLAQIAADHPDKDFVSNMIRQVQTMALSNLPQVSGLNQFLQGNMRGGLDQMLQPLMRILSGLFMMKGESATPKALPNEKALAELAAIFSAQTEKARRRRKDRSKGKRKELRGSFFCREYENAIPRENEDENEEEGEALSALAS